MSLAVSPSGFWLYRTSNSQWLGNSGSSNESYGSSPYQHYVDFDLLGPRFRVIFAGNLASSGVDAPGFTWNLRIGGTLATGTAFQACDGDLVTLGPTGAIPAFGAGASSAEIDNVWTGVQLVKLTGQIAGGDGFAQRPTLLFFPVEA